MEKIINSLKEMKYIDNQIHINNINYKRILSKFDTPIILYSEKTLLRNIKEIKKAFRKYYKNTNIHYALKACYLRKICEKIKKEGLKIEILSDIEYIYGRKIGFDKKDIIFNGCAKTEQELKLVIKEEIKCINCDSLSEINKINYLAKKMNKVVNVGLRVHPDIKDNSLFVNRGEKLGIDIKSGEAFRLVKDIKKLKNLNLVGLNCHVLANEVSPNMHCRVAEELCKFYKFLKSKEIDIKFIDIGGGFNSNFLIKNKNCSMEFFAARISKILKKYNFDGELILEPGRYIVNDAFAALTNVITKKKSVGKKWVIVDIGTNILIPTRHNRFYPISCTKTEGKEIINIGDGIGSTAGVISRNIQSYKIKENDCMVILNCGSYTLSMSENFVYLKPNIIMVDDGMKLIEKGMNINEFIKKVY
ncbi:hypothetical protein CEE44_04090 [Candidatus Woesearchaeota archaeon B3_Woes]|nr:MAG: hypothetical protein CEE44_04090 [Candidatus Woesearchaeota archaeon B3_Woes]